MKSKVINSLFNRKENPISTIVSAFNPTDLWKELKWVLTMDEDFDRYPEVTFQVSLGWKSTEQEPKFDFNRKPGNGLYNGINLTGWGKNYPKTDKPGYNGCDWHTVTTSLNVLPLLSQAGFAVRFGIKEGSNDKNDFEFAELIGFDLDKDPSMTWEDTLEICQRNVIDPLTIYFSPSGDETNNKLRMFIAFDRKMTYQEYWIMSKRIALLLPNCNPIPTANQFWYGSLKPLLYVSEQTQLVSYEYLDANLPELPEEEKQEFEKQKQQQPRQEQIDTEEITVKRRAYITEKIINEKYNGDYTALIDEWIDEFNEQGGNLYKGEWFPRGSQNGSIDTMNGRDPILGGDSDDSNSFVVSLQPDNSVQVTSRKHRNIGGDLVWLHHKLEYGSWDVADMSNKEYTKRYLSILEKYNVPLELFFPVTRMSYQKQLEAAIYNSVEEVNDPDFGNIHVLSMKLARAKIAPRLLACAFFESMDGKLKRYMPPKGSGAIVYLYYNGKQWITVDVDYVVTLYSDWVVTLEIDHPECKDTVPLHFGTLHFDQVRKMIINIDPEFRTDELPPIDTFWLGFNDCIVHALNKTVLTENPDRINCRTAYNINYEQWREIIDSESSPVLDELVEECSKNLAYPELKPLIRPLAIISILGYLQYTGMGVLSCGDAGSFKTTLPEICGKAMGEDNYYIFKAHRIAEFINDSHARSLVEYVNLIILDDAEPIRELVGMVRDYILGRIEEEDKGTLRVDLNQKNEKRRIARVTWGIWITCNDFVFQNQRADKKTFAALVRRLIYLPYRKTTQKADKSFIANFLINGRDQQLLMECLKEISIDTINYIADLETNAPSIRSLMNELMIGEAKKTSDMHLVDECMTYEEGFVIPIDLLCAAEKLYKSMYGGSNTSKDSHYSIKAYCDYIKDVLGLETKENFKFDWMYADEKKNNNFKGSLKKSGLLNMRFTEEFEQALGLSDSIVAKTKYRYYGREALDNAMSILRNASAYAMN